MKTYTAKLAEIKRDRHVIDAADQTLGRLSTQIAKLLMGKHKPMYSPAQDIGRFRRGYQRPESAFHRQKSRAENSITATPTTPAGLRASLWAK